MSTEPDWMAAAEAIAREIKRQEGVYRHAVDAMLKAGSLQNAIKESQARLTKLAKDEAEASDRVRKAEALAQEAQQLAVKAGQVDRDKANAEAAQIVTDAKRKAEAVIAKADLAAKKLQEEASADRAQASAVLDNANAAAKKVRDETDAQSQKLAGVLAEVRRVEALRDALRGQLAGAVA